METSLARGQSTPLTPETERGERGERGKREREREKREREREKRGRERERGGRGGGEAADRQADRACSVATEPPPVLWGWVFMVGWPALSEHRRSYGT